MDVFDCIIAFWGIHTVYALYSLTYGVCTVCAPMEWGFSLFSDTHRLQLGTVYTNISVRALIVIGDQSCYCHVVRNLDDGVGVKNISVLLQDFDCGKSPPQSNPCAY